MAPAPRKGSASTHYPLVSTQRVRAGQPGPGERADRLLLAVEHPRGQKHLMDNGNGEPGR